VILNQWRYFLENDAVDLNGDTLLKLQLGDSWYDYIPISLAHMKRIQSSCLRLEHLCVAMHLLRGPVRRLSVVKLS
jgi:hypothetical protein